MWWSDRGAAWSVRRACRPIALRSSSSSLLAVLKDAEFQARAKQAGFIVGPGDAKTTAARFKSDDAALYPILLEAGLVKARQK